MEELEQEVADLGVSTPPRRSGRKRLFCEPPPTPPAKNSRTSRRKGMPASLTADKLKKFYMNKTSAKFARQALETIYEEPLPGKNGVPVLIGAAKVKRAINMDLLSTTKMKKLGRKKKVKRLGTVVRFKKLSDEDFKRRLKMIEAQLSEKAGKVEEKPPTIVEENPLADVSCSERLGSLSLMDVQDPNGG